MSSPGAHDADAIRRRFAAIVERVAARVEVRERREHDRLARCEQRRREHELRAAREAAEGAWERGEVANRKPEEDAMTAEARE